MIRIKIVLGALAITAVFASCKTMHIPVNEKKNNFTETSNHPIIKTVPGIEVYDETFINYKTSNGKSYQVLFKQPSVVSVADKPYGWGYYQFPSIGYMKDDNPDAYGKRSLFSYVSDDKGKTWKYISNDEEGFGGLKTLSGDYIKTDVPSNIPLSQLNLGKPDGKGIMAYVQKPVDLYLIDKLPESRKGVFLERLKKNENAWNLEQSRLIDPGGYRYSYNNMMPVVWLGDMRVAKDNIIYTCVYRDYRHGASDTKEGYMKEGMGCFSSKDNGYTWQFEGASFYTGGDKSVDSIAEKRAGWLEPGMEILKDGSFVCILRTDDGQGKGPMYLVRSYDKGKTWSAPKAITRYGVLPRLLLLENGVLVMSSGRPGVSIRFSADNGNTWTEAFEQLPVPYSDEWNYTCGYTNMIPTGKNSFLIVYSDFKYKNEKGEERKAIKVREVIIDKK